MAKRIIWIMRLYMAGHWEIQPAIHSMTLFNELLHLTTSCLPILITVIKCNSATPCQSRLLPRSMPGP